MTMQAMFALECSNVDLIPAGGERMAVTCRSDAVCRCQDCGRALCVIHQLPDGRCDVCTLGEQEPVEEGATR